MDAADAWNALFAKVSENGLESLSSRERMLHRVNSFLIDFDMGGLSGFLYNVSQKTEGAMRWSELRAVAEAASETGTPEIAGLLHEVADLLEALPPAGSGTWGQFIDPVRAPLQALEARLVAYTESLWERLETISSTDAHAAAEC